MKRLLMTGLLLLSCVKPALAQGVPSVEKMRARDLAAQMRLLMAWWPGQYDNHEQIVRQSGGGLSPLLYRPFHRIHSTVAVVSAPQLGDHVLSISQYADDDPKNVVRSEFAVLSVDAAAQAIRVKRYAGTDPATAALRPGCDLLLTFTGGQFEGGVAASTCPAKAGLSEYQLRIGEQSFWERDQGRDPKSKAVKWEMAPGAGYDWTMQSRARPFTCHVFENAQNIMAKTEYLTTIHLHDQGGAADIAWPDGRTLTFTIHNRAFTATPDREYPLFRVHEKGNPVPIAYAYAVDRTRRFGLNLGWFYIRCYDDSDLDPNDRPDLAKK